MKNTLPTLLAVFLLMGCATYKPKYADNIEEPIAQDSTQLSHTFYLIGDAGKSPIGGMNPALKAFKNRLDVANENSTAIFLGDNIYPAGLPDSKDSTQAYRIAKSHLDAQLKTLDNFKGKKVFIPGNHDWYTEGLVGLKRQEKYIEKSLGSKEVFFPENGCPIESFEIGDDIAVITIDTEWYVTNWDKRPEINDKCEIKDRESFFVELEDEIKDNREKTTIIAMHHPMFTYGPHGGQYSFKKHFYPNNGKVPLPVIGTLINVLRRTTGASIADLQNKRYNQLKKRIVTLAQFSDKVIFVSGHEHTLQYIVEENTPQIVSGSGAKKGDTRLLNGSKFSTGQMGYAVLNVFKNGSSQVDFYGVENDNEIPLFSSNVLPPDRKAFIYEGLEDFPATKEASVYTEEEIDKSGFYKALWGDRYRKYYGTKVKVPVVEIDTLYGGLKPVKKGGGHQSKSLRLEHADGRQFVMRALRKGAERYLQSIAFKDQYILGEFEGTAIVDIIEDFYTGAHPYAPFTIDKIADAVDLYHTNPRLFYVPKQKALEDYNDDFGDELYMIEEHVSEGHNVASLGYAKKIESTKDVFDKLRRDEKYQLDSETFVRARLFDILLGDWDRHPDQWRWIEREQDDDKILFVPIPRDRDQVFSNMGDGALIGFGQKIMPGLKIFEGFNEKVKSVIGLNGSPKTFALDLALLSETTLDTWRKQAKFIQKNITEKVIDEAFLAFPPEVRDETVDIIKRNLLSRKEHLVKNAEDYYQFLNRFSVITGTDKDDHFVITPLDNGALDVKGFRIKDGEKADLFFNKRYSDEITKEIWIYALDDDDIFEVQGNSGKIRMRLVGGHDNDVYKIAEAAKRVHIYDFEHKKNTYDEMYSGHLHKRRDYDTNTYIFNKIKASSNQILPTVGFNPDDGVKIGLKNVYTYNGFGQNPFTQQHSLDAAFYFATSGFDIGYSGEFANIIDEINLEISARFTSPNFSRNFFGFGNETPNFDDDLDFDFNRVKIRTVQFAPALVVRGQLGSKVRLGVSYENYDVDETEGRFIDDFYSGQGRDSQQAFFGVDASYSYANTDNEAFPTMGMAFMLHGGYKTNLTDTGRDYGFIIPSLSFDYKISSDGRLVLATKFKGHFNIGDDYEFYQAASIGANDGLRGFRFQRFTGKTAYYQNTDLRYSFRKRKTGILPVTPGIYGGFDYGRVWFPGDASDRWHNSYGGGFFINGAEMISANIGLFNSVDGIRFAFGIGFGF